MTQHVDNVDTSGPGPDDPVEGKRPPAAKGLRGRQAFTVFAVAAIAYVVWKVPPYLSLDPNNSRVPLEFPLHFALLSGHVICGSISLVTTVLQLWPWLRRNHPAVHRIRGRVYILAGALPSAALALALYPVTPGPGRVAVLVAASLWSTTAIFGWLAARRKRYVEHRRWMVYSFAIMWGYGVWFFFVARALLFLGVSENTTVEAARWIDWTATLLIAHWWLERTAGRTIIGTPRRSAKLRKAAANDSVSAAVQPTNT